MSNPLLRVFSSLTESRRVVEAVRPRRSFDDVILPSATRRALDQALAHVTSHDLIFNRWGLGERHPTGLALAFNFAGPRGTGKTICAEAIAHALGRRLLVVRYAEVESMWMGATPKNVSAVFRLAREENAVVLFDEADAIASRRSATLEHGFLRETNTVVNVLLKELETFNGVVIFATNLAANSIRHSSAASTHVFSRCQGSTNGSRSGGCRCIRRSRHWPAASISAPWRRPTKSAAVTSGTRC
jgi:SpoVK/Ycf46/Vps4 family AAA+-type ATPase